MSLGSLSGQIGGKIEGDASASNENRHLYSAAQEFMRNTNFTASLNQAITGVQEHNFRTADETGQRLAQSVSSSFDQAEQARHEAMASYQESKAYRQVASYAEENATSINSNASQGFMNWMQHQGQSSAAIEDMMVNHPKKAQALAEQYTREQAQQFLHAFKSQAHTSSTSIENDFTRDNQQVSGNQTVSADYTNQHGNLLNQAEHEGLNLNHEVSKQAVTKAQQILDANQSAVTSGKTALTNKETHLTNNIKNKVD
jgi:hypothetical protein